MAASRTARRSRATAKSTRQAADTRVDNAASSDGKSVAEHSAHPEDPSDPSVRHAADPASIVKPTAEPHEGTAGYPAGEYDVVKPAPSEAKEQTVVEAHLAAVDVDTLKAAMKDTVLDPDEYALVLEASGVGFELVHEGDNRWRARQNQRFGHGRTAKEAIEAFVLGTSSVTLQDAAAREFLALSPAQQQEIRERDQAAAGAVGLGAREAYAAEETRKTFAKRQGAALPASGARTDASEQMSASQATGKAAKQGAKKGAKRSSRKR
jgi:hypothetical protein